MYQFTDSSSSDSEDGIRYKTDSTRHKKVHASTSSRRRTSRDRSRSHSPNRHKRHKHGKHKHRRHKHRSRRESPSPERRRLHSKSSERQDAKRICISESNLSVAKKLNKSESSESEKLEDISSDDDVPDEAPCINGPSAHSNHVINGPALPPHLSNKTDTTIGPALPPRIKESSISPANNEKCIGPILPPHLRQRLEEISNITDEVDEADDDTYGPLPPDMVSNSKAHMALEERALQLKIDKLNPTTEEKLRREEWMTELPPVQLANLGLGPRQFRAKAGPDLSDRSSWTDTPQDKEDKKTSEPKVDVRKEAELQAIRTRDEEQEKMNKKHKKKSKSLLQQHQDKLKLKKKDEKEANVRRPFNRDIDLKVNQFDEAQKKAIFKKAQLLDDRFSGGQSKYL